MTNLEIEAFLALCRQKTVTGAAAELYVSQSSLSTRLKRLEQELGYPLFLRQKGGREIELTAEGRTFYDLALQYEELVQKMAAVGKGALPERLRVASINSVGTYLLPPVYERFMQRCPEVQLEIQDMETDLACQKLLQGETDLAFTTESRDSDRIDAFPVLMEPMVLICAPETALPPVVEREMLAVQNEVYIGWCEAYSRWHRSAFGADAVPRIRLEIMGQLAHFIQKRDSWAIVPAGVAEGLAGQEEIRVCRTAFPVPERVVYALCPRGMGDSPAIARFLECLPSGRLLPPPTTEQ